MTELVRDLRVINVLAKFENDPWKIMDVRVLTGLVCPAARPHGRRQAYFTPFFLPLKGCGVKRCDRRMDSQTDRRTDWTIHRTAWSQLKMNRRKLKAPIIEPTTVGSLRLENDLHENELESHMGISKKFVCVILDEIHGNPRDLNICISPAAAVNPCPQSEFPWKESPWN